MGVLVGFCLALLLVRFQERMLPRPIVYAVSAEEAAEEEKKAQQRDDEWRKKHHADMEALKTAEADLRAKMRIRIAETIQKCLNERGAMIVGIGPEPDGPIACQFPFGELPAPHWLGQEANK